jgi:hypothetical protein
VMRTAAQSMPLFYERTLNGQQSLLDSDLDVLRLHPREIRLKSCKCIADTGKRVLKKTYRDLELVVGLREIKSELAELGRGCVCVVWVHVFVWFWRTLCA